MADAKPLTREERETLQWAWGADNAFATFADSDIARYEVTVRALETRNEALREALEAIAYDGYVRQISQARRLAIEAIEQAS